jgi:hypothetical protein
VFCRSCRRRDFVGACAGGVQPFCLNGMIIVDIIMGCGEGGPAACRCARRWRSLFQNLTRRAVSAADRSGRRRAGGRTCGEISGRKTKPLATMAVAGSNDGGMRDLRRVAPRGACERRAGSKANKPRPVGWGGTRVPPTTASGPRRRLTAPSRKSARRRRASGGAGGRGRPGSCGAARSCRHASWREALPRPSRSRRPSRRRRRRRGRSFR